MILLETGKKRGPKTDNPKPYRMAVKYDEECKQILEAYCAQENVNMMEAADNVTTGQITYAARNSNFEGYDIKEGDILAMINGKLSFTETDAIKATVKLTNKMCTKNSSFVTVIYGEDISDAQAEEVVSKLEEKLPSGIEISAVKGNQPVYYFIISVE